MKRKKRELLNEIYNLSGKLKELKTESDKVKEKYKLFEEKVKAVEEKLEQKKNEYRKMVHFKTIDEIIDWFKKKYKRYFEGFVEENFRFDFEDWYDWYESGWEGFVGKKVYIFKRSERCKKIKKCSKGGFIHNYRLLYEGRFKSSGRGDWGAIDNKKGLLIKKVSYCGKREDKKTFKELDETCVSLFKVGLFAEYDGRVVQVSAVDVSSLPEEDQEKVLTVLSKIMKVDLSPFRGKARGSIMKEYISDIDLLSYGF